MTAVRFRTAVLFFTLAAFALRAYGLHHKSFWLDEVDAISMAGEPIARQLRKLAAIGENGPLYFLLFKGWIALAGTGEYAARMLSCLASTVAVPLIATLAKRLTRDPRVALAAALLAGGSPFYVWYAQDAKRCT
jgi:mannosyltransferase